MRTRRKISNSRFTNSGNIAEVEIHYRHQVKPSSLPRITCSEEVYGILKTIWDWSKIEYLEEFVILLLNRNNRVLGWTKIAMGGVNGTFVDPKIIFQLALTANASSIILAHNHPSGNIQPSSSDIALTKKIKEAGEILDVKVIDHVIVTSEWYFSLADEGLI